MLSLRSATLGALSAGLATASPAFAQLIVEHEGFYFWDVFLAGLVALILVVLLSIHFLPHMKKREKKFVFIVYVIIAVGVTGYTAASTVYLNMISSSGGPVHWHADFEIWVCGQKVDIRHSEGWDNKVGEPLIHTHDDLRIHIEGVLMRKEEARVGEFFRAIGGELSPTRLTVPLADKTVRTWQNDQLCPNGNPGKIRMFVNGKENFEFGNYIIAPYPDIPPGDYLNITFGDS